MAVQELDRWCKETVNDGVTGEDNKRDLLTEEFLNGWVRNATVSTQQMNSILFLLSTNAAPYAHCVYYMPDTEATPSVAYDMDGSTFTQAEAPNLYDIYSGTLPDLTADASTPTGFKPIIRIS